MPLNKSYEISSKLKGISKYYCGILQLDAKRERMLTKRVLDKI